MAANDVNKVLLLGGSLVRDPTNLSAAYPHGGTELGVLSDGHVVPYFKTSSVKGAEDKHSNQTVETVYLGESWVFGVTLRQFDSDAVGAVFPNKGTTGPQKKAASSVKPGYRLSNRSMRLLFVPTNASHPAILLYRVLPMIKETDELHTRAISEFAFQALFECIPDTNGNVHAMDLLSNLSLT